MGTIIKYSAVFVCVLLGFAGFALAEPQAPAIGGQLPDFTLPVPKTNEHQEYLGLTGKESFKIPEITAEVVIIEIFSMY